MPCGKHFAFNRLSTVRRLVGRRRPPLSGKWTAAIEPSIDSTPTGTSPSRWQRIFWPKMASSWFRCIRAGRPPGISPLIKRIASPTHSQAVGSNVPGQSKASWKAE